jgi:putative alpha-1,2-mannosidase
LVNKLNFPGNVFPGATIPYGMAKPGADTDSPSNQGGFVADGSNVTGFSNLHDSGTGGSPSLGNFALFPYPSCPGDDINRCKYHKRSRKIPYDPNSIQSTPGYFGLNLSNGVGVDMTATHHTSLFRFKFPTSGQDNSTGYPLILLDLTDLSDSRQDNGTISVDSNGRMTGGARFLPSFGSGSYRAYFCADFTGGQIHDTGIFVDTRASTAVQNLTISRSINGYPLPGGAFIRFEPNPVGPVLARVGLSFIDEARACQNAQNEISDFDFDGVKAAAEAKWREKVSNVIVDDSGANSSFSKIFYSGMYRTMISPQDYSNENPLWTSTEPYFDSLYW